MQRDRDVLVVGAGFAGLRALHTLRGQGLSVAVLEAGDGIGGVWHANRYPGARCDVASYDYSYAFSPELEQEWRWTERYARQPEILRYVHHVADRFDLHRDVHLARRVVEAVWDGARWHVETDDAARWSGRHLVMAVGNLSTTKEPSLPGRDGYRGTVLHSARWPREGVDLAGRRVGIVGTGSSGMQMVPVVAREAAHLTVFQRTANYSVPAAQRTISDVEDAAVKARYAQRRRAALNSPSGLGFVPDKQSALEVSPAERRAAYEKAWANLGFGFVLAYRDLILDQAANDTASDFIREKIAGQVDDPVVRELLTPRGFPFATKRPSVDDGYYATFNRADVTLVDVGTDPLAGFTQDGVVTASGREHPLDVVVLATGFDAMTGSLLRPQIVGRDGRTLREHWAAGPRTFLGLLTAGFPNLFVIAGPGSPSLLSNVLLSIEQHVDWLAALLRHAGDAVIEADPAAETRWTAHVAERAAATLYPRAASYYGGAELPGKPRVFMPYVGGVRGYRRILEQVAASGYAGLTISGAAASFTAG